jgi:hypothetical protein
MISTKLAQKNRGVKMQEAIKNKGGIMTSSTVENNRVRLYPLK